MSENFENRELRENNLTNPGRSNDADRRKSYGLRSQKDILAKHPSLQSESPHESDVRSYG